MNCLRDIVRMTKVYVGVSGVIEGLDDAQKVFGEVERNRDVAAFWYRGISIPERGVYFRGVIRYTGDVNDIEFVAKVAVLVGTFPLGYCVVNERSDCSVGELFGMMQRVEDDVEDEDVTEGMVLAGGSKAMELEMAGDDSANGRYVVVGRKWKGFGDLLRLSQLLQFGHDFLADRLFEDLKQGDEGDRITVGYNWILGELKAQIDMEDGSVSDL